MSRESMLGSCPSFIYRYVAVSVFAVAQIGDRSELRNWLLFLPCRLWWVAEEAVLVLLPSFAAGIFRE